MIAALPLLLLPFPAQDGPLPAVPVAADDVEITASCRIRLAGGVLADDERDGVLRITADDVTVDLAGAHLRGAEPGVDPDAYEGVGIWITGDRVTLKNARVSGYRCAIRVSGATGVVLAGCDVSDNRRQRLRSTPEAEDPADWLRPHANDQDEWMELYGAAIWAEDCGELVVRDCRARDGQNGLVLVRSNDSQVYDNDLSFLSGWGVALWRSSRNLISRNALDFCVRGYSHGVYNRGQDAAGILCFEQSSDNEFVENSATHGGDGFFGFAGKEALGEMPPPSADFDYAGRGCNGNVLYKNDLSYAAAHGIEMTFSFDNWFRSNRLVENAICGIWAGYARDTWILDNDLERNGDAGYGLERGGVNAEHAQGLQVRDNRFRGNACGVHLWWDEDAQLRDLPWMRANGMACGDNQVGGNAFAGDAVGVHLRACPSVVGENRFEDVERELVVEGEPPEDGPILAIEIDVALPSPEILGETHPVGARAHLRGREHIVMTAWGPYDHEGMHARRLPTDDARVHRWEILGGANAKRAAELEGCQATAVADGGSMIFEARSNRPGGVARYAAWFEHEATGDRVEITGTIVASPWEVTSFAWTADPREDADAWRAEAGKGVAWTAPRLDLAFGTGGPAAVGAPADVGADRFGTLATTKVTLPAGRWRVRTTSDDGIRVWVDGDLVIDDWTWHAPKRADAEVLIERPQEVELRVEHFELDGLAVLQVALEPAP